MIYRTILLERGPIDINAIPCEKEQSNSANLSLQQTQVRIRTTGKCIVTRLRLTAIISFY